MHAKPGLSLGAAEQGPDSPVSPGHALFRQRGEKRAPHRQRHGAVWDRNATAPRCGCEPAHESRALCVKGPTQYVPTEPLTPSTYNYKR